MMKKLLLGILAAFAVLFTSNTVMAYPDVPANHWAAKEINELSEQGVLYGYPDGTFQQISIWVFGSSAHPQKTPPI